jgi:hypothetical protein
MLCSQISKAQCCFFLSSRAQRGNSKQVRLLQTNRVPAIPHGPSPISPPASELLGIGSKLRSPWGKEQKFACRVCQGRAIWKEESMTKLLGKALAGATIGAGLLAMSTIGASAAIACRGNVCWHTHETFAYPPDARVVIHEDNWRWGPRERFVFREHEGRGYWRGDRWMAW